MKHLAQNQLEDLLKAMELREKELRARIVEERERANREGYSQLKELVGDEADQAFANMRAGIESELLDSHINELNAIDAARTRIADRTFGLCVDCGGEIEYARLQASPSACRCAHCQALHEKTSADNMR